MTQRSSDQDARIKGFLDALRITPQRFLHSEHDIGREAVTTVDTIDPVLIRPSRIRWPLTELWRINLDTFNQRLQITLGSVPKLRRRFLGNKRTEGVRFQVKPPDVSWQYLAT